MIWDSPICLDCFLWIPSKHVMSLLLVLCRGVTLPYDTLFFLVEKKWHEKRSSGTDKYIPKLSLLWCNMTNNIRWERKPKQNTHCALAGGTFFQLCHSVSFFWLWREIVLGVTYLPYQLCRCVWLHRSVFWLWREKVLGVTYIPTIPVVPLCQFFGFSGK